MRISLRVPSILLGLAISGAGVVSCETGPTSPESQSQRISLSATVLEFFRDQDERSLRVTNTQDVSIDWFVKSYSAPWVVVAPSFGTLEAGASRDLSVRVDRSGLSDGTSSATIEFEGGGRSTSLVVTVEHDPDASPKASLDPTSLSLGPNDDSDIVEVVNLGDAPLDWTMDGPDWLEIEPESGQVAAGERRQVVVRPDRSLLNHGVHDGTLSLSSNGGSPTASISVEVGEASTFHLDPASLDFGTTTQQLTLRVHNDADRSIDWSGDPGVEWISMAPSAGTIPAGSSQSVTVGVSRSGLASGSHLAAIRFTSSNGTAAARVLVTVPASEGSPARLEIVPASLDFGEIKTELPLRIVNSGGMALDWSIGDGTKWVKLSSSSGRLLANGSQEVLVTVSRSDLSSGSYKTRIPVTSNGGDSEVSIFMTVPSPESPPPESPPDTTDGGDGGEDGGDIDATGRTDVTDELNAYLASVPDGSTITFPAGARYRVEGTLGLRDRHGLTIEGNGATIFAKTDGSDVPHSRIHIALSGGGGITIRNLTIESTNVDAVYRTALEGQHAIKALGVQGITVERVTVRNVHGDFVYFGFDTKNKLRTTNAVVRNCNFSGSGRQGIAMTNVEHVVIEDNAIGRVARSVFDIEPHPGARVMDVAIRRNQIGEKGNKFVAAGGAGIDVGGIVVEDNVLTGSIMGVHVKGGLGKDIEHPYPGKRRGSFTFLRNRSDTPRAPGGQGLMIFDTVTSVTVRDNVQPFPPAKQHTIFVEIRDVLSYDVGGNKVPDVGEELVVSQ